MRPCQAAIRHSQAQLTHYQGSWLSDCTSVARILHSIARDKPLFVRKTLRALQHVPTPGNHKRDQQQPKQYGFRMLKWSVLKRSIGQNGYAFESVALASLAATYTGGSRDSEASVGGCFAASC
jgi:hypothetical protein